MPTKTPDTLEGDNQTLEGTMTPVAPFLTRQVPCSQAYAGV